MQKKPLNQLIQHEKRIAIQQSIFQKYANLSDEAKEVVQLVMRHQIERSTMPVRMIYAQPMVEQLVDENDQHKKTIDELKQTVADLENQNRSRNTMVAYGHVSEEVKTKLTQALKEPSQVVPDYADGIFGETKHTGLIVQNWHTAWKWISTWAFGLIAYVSVAGIPPEVLALVPEASQSKVTAALALLGFLGRFINQSRGK